MALTQTPFAGMIVGLAAGVGSTVCLVANRAIEFTAPGQRIVDGSLRTHHVSFKPVLPDISEPNLEQTSEQTLRTKIEWLEQGAEFLQQQPGYTARFEKQELVDGTLLDPQAMFMKCRHHPFSVYLQWEKGDIGREVLYVEGENNGKLIGHDGGWKARLPSLSLKPQSSLAMRDARYPVTDAGILGLIHIMLDTHRHDLAEGNYSSCEKAQGEFRGRTCTVFTTRYKNAAASPTYRKSVTCLDNEWKIPLHTEHFEWPKTGQDRSEQEVDNTTLIESYQFSEIALDYHPTAADFERDNPEYHFQ